MHSRLCEFGNYTGYITKTSICMKVFIVFQSYFMKTYPITCFKKVFLDNIRAFPLNLCVNISSS